MSKTNNKGFVESFKNTPNFFTEETESQVPDNSAALEVEEDFGAPSIKDNSTVTSASGYINSETGNSVIYDQNEINALRLRQSSDILKNMLLGHFDEATGEYVVSENILIELLLIVKKLDHTMKSTHFCSSVSNFNGLGALEFVCQTTYLGNEASTKMFILEPIEKMGGLVENTNVHLVATYSAANDEAYVSNMFNAFNIIDDSIHLDEYTINNNANLWLTRRKEYLKQLNEIASAKQEFFESKLLNKRLAILAQLGPYGVEVIQAFEAIKGKGKNLVGESLSAKDMNEMLELALESKKGKIQFKKLEAKFYAEQAKEIALYNTEIERLKETESKTIQAKLGPKPEKKKVSDPPPEMFPKGLKLKFDAPKSAGGKPPDKKPDAKKEEPKKIIVGKIELHAPKPKEAPKEQKVEKKEEVDLVNSFNLNNLDNLLNKKTVILDENNKENKNDIDYYQTNKKITTKTFNGPLL